MKLSAACVLSVVCVVLPASALDCSAKRDFKLLDIYGSAEQAQKCFAVAVSTFKSKWNVDTHTGPCLRAAFHDAGTWQVDAVPAEGTYPVQCGGANGSFKKEIEEGQRLGFKCDMTAQNAVP
eukprot:18349-Heterococcus_DN1.PRE.1